MDSGSVVVVGSNVWLHLKLRIMEVERWRTEDGGQSASVHRLLCHPQTRCFSLPSG